MKDFVASIPKITKKSREKHVFGKAHSFLLRLSTFYFSCTYISTFGFRLSVTRSFNMGVRYLHHSLNIKITLRP